MELVYAKLREMLHACIERVQANDLTAARDELRRFGQASIPDEETSELAIAVVLSFLQEIQGRATGNCWPRFFDFLLEEVSSRLSPRESVKFSVTVSEALLSVGYIREAQSILERSADGPQDYADSTFPNLFKLAEIHCLRNNLVDARQVYIRILNRLRSVRAASREQIEAVAQAENALKHLAFSDHDSPIE